jgi:hypothetical protein
MTGRQQLITERSSGSTRIFRLRAPSNNAWLVIVALAFLCFNIFVGVFVHQALSNVSAAPMEEDTTPKRD